MTLAFKITELSSFRSRVFWSLVPIVVILFILLEIVDLQQHRRLTEEEFSKKAETIVINLAETTRLAVLTGDRQLLEAATRSVTEVADFAFLRIYGENWRSLYSQDRTRRSIPKPDETLSDEQKTSLLNQETALLAGPQGPGKERFTEYLAPITIVDPETSYELVTEGRELNAQQGQEKRRVIGAVRLGLSLSEVDAHMASLLRWRIGLIVVFLILSAITIYFLAGRITRPVRELTAQVNKMAEGDLDQTIPVTSKDEVGVLAASFNEMARSLKELYAGLEDKVARRTEQLSAANRKLEQASEHKSRFLANVNHELRTPLSSIIGYTRLLQRETQGQITSLQRENLEDLLRNAERLLGLIDSLLDMAKIEAGKIELQIKSVKVDDIIHGAAATVEPMLDKDKVRLVCDASANLEPFDTDAEKLNEIILNLLGNAVKFTEEGEIKISAVQENGNLRLTVCDTGIGIDPSDTDRIFEEFSRGRWMSNGTYLGTGLGLAIVKRLVDLLGGSIDVESEVGKGSTFTVTLPARAGSDETV